MLKFLHHEETLIHFGKYLMALFMVHCSRKGYYVFLIMISNLHLVFRINMQHGAGKSALSHYMLIIEEITKYNNSLKEIWEKENQLKHPVFVNRIDLSR